MLAYDKMVAALQTVRPAEARVVASLLEGYRIRSFIRASSPTSIYPLGLHDTTLLVPESQLDEAERLIRSHRAHLRLVYTRGSK